MTSTAKSIAAAVKAIPEKKESLKRAFEELQAHSCSLASFTLQWKDLEEHFSSIEKSFETRLRELQSREKDAPSAPEKSPAAAKREEAEAEAEPRPELKSACVRMDGKRLRSFINENRKDLPQIRKELTPAIRAAPDPARIVLDAMDGFYPAKPKGDAPTEAELHAHRRTCILLLERLHVISPDIKPPVRDRAKKLAADWKGKVPADGGQNGLEALAFLQLLASYDITSEFYAAEVLDLLVCIARRKQTVDLCRDLGLAEKIPDLIQKLSGKGRQIDAVKFVYAFELVEMFPPVPLLKAYIKESRKIAQELRKKCNNSAQSQNEATSKELAAVKAVIRTIEEYKLESEYSPEGLQKRVAQLEQQKAQKKRTATSAAGSNMKAHTQHQQQINKRPRPSTNTVSTVSAQPVAPPPQIQSQQPLTDRYLISAGSYGLTGSGMLYDHAGSSFIANPLGLGINRSPLRSYPYSSESLTGSGLYDRPAYGSGYPLSGGLPPQYNSLSGGLPPQYNSLSGGLPPQYKSAHYP